MAIFVYFHFKRFGNYFNMTENRRRKREGCFVGVAIHYSSVLGGKFQPEVVVGAFGPQMSDMVLNGLKAWPESISWNSAGDISNILDIHTCTEYQSVKNTKVRHDLFVTVLKYQLSNILKHWIKENEKFLFHNPALQLRRHINEQVHKVKFCQFLINNKATCIYIYIWCMSAIFLVIYKTWVQYLQSSGRGWVCGVGSGLSTCARLRGPPARG